MEKARALELMEEFYGDGMREKRAVEGFTLGMISASVTSPTSTAKSLQSVRNIVEAWTSFSKKK